MSEAETATAKVDTAVSGPGAEAEVNKNYSIEAMAPEDISLDMCVEVVYSFKCKFCTFTTSTPQDVTSHVRSVHLKDRKTPLLVPDIKLSPTKAASKLPSELTTAATTQGLPSKSEQPDLNQDGQVQVVSETQTVEQGTLATEPPHLEQAVVEELVIDNSMGELGPSSGTLSATETVIGTEGHFDFQNNTGIHVEVISQSDVQPVSEQLEENLNRGQVYKILNFEVKDEVETAGETSSPAPSTDVAAALAPANHSMLAVSEAEAIASSSSAGGENRGLAETMASSAVGQEDALASEVQLEMLHDSALEVEPTTKEIYICGQCSEGYATMNDCKQHMADTHNISFANANIEISSGSGESLELPSHKVSVGTQAMTYKKPGRKRKRRPGDDSPVMPEPGVDIKEFKEEDEEMAQLHSEEEREVTYTRSGRKAQRIPKALREDYVVAKRKYRKRATSPRSGQGGAKLRCPTEWCKAKFTTEESLKIHRECHDDGDDIYTPFRCTKCSSVFTAWKVLRMHLWKEHSVDLDLHKCLSCDYRIDTLSKLELHAKTHGSARPYVCITCGKSFKQQTQLANHQTCHLSEAEKPANVWYNRCSCDICGRSYCNRRSLKAHVEAVHKKVKPFVCSYCGHATARKAMLQLHIRTHTGDKPFKCDLCTYATSDHNTLRRHRMRHTGQKVYFCPHCPYGCIQAVSLKTHIKNKHPESVNQGIFNCKLCHYHTVNPTFWHNHCQDHRNGLIATMQETPQRRITPSSKRNTVQIAPVELTPRKGLLHSILKEDLVNSSAKTAEATSESAETAQIIYSALSAASQQQGPQVSDGGNQTVVYQTGQSVAVAENHAAGPDPGMQTIMVTLPIRQAAAEKPFVVTVQHEDAETADNRSASVDSENASVSRSAAVYIETDPMASGSGTPLEGVLSAVQDMQEGCESQVLALKDQDGNEHVVTLTPVEHLTYGSSSH